jgi:hypothetical protein
VNFCNSVSRANNEILKDYELFGRYKGTCLAKNAWQKIKPAMGLIARSSF